jgi:hypothetical protein
MGFDKLPRLGMPQLDRLLAERPSPASPGREVDGPNGNLGCQAEGVGGSGAARNDDFAPSRCELLDDLLWKWRPHSILRFDRPHIHAAPKSHDLAVPSQPRKRLIECRPI